MARKKKEETKKKEYGYLYDIPLNLEGVWFDRLDKLMDMDNGDDEDRWHIALMWGDKLVFEFEIGYDYDTITHYEKLQADDYTLVDDTGYTRFELFLNHVEKMVRKIGDEYKKVTGDEVEYEEYYESLEEYNEAVEREGKKEDVEWSTPFNFMGDGGNEDIPAKMDYLVKLLPTLFEVKEIAETSRTISNVYGVNNYYIMLGDRGLFNLRERFSNHALLGATTELKAKSLQTIDRAEALKRAEYVKEKTHWKQGMGEIIWQGRMKFELSVEDYLSIYK